VTRNRTLTSPAMLASVLLHAGLLAAALIAWPAKKLPMGTVVPVNIVSNAMTTNTREMQQAPEETPAMTEAPIPDAQPEPPAPTPQPTPAPPTPAPKAAPAPTPQPKAPTPKPATPAAKAPTAKTPAPKTPPRKAESSFDLDALERELASSSKSQARPSNAAKGPSRPATAREARPAVGQGDQVAAFKGLSEELQRRWNPNCEVEGGRDVRLKVTFTIGPAGSVIGEVTAGGAERSPNAVIRAAAERAIRAVYAASPFRSIPRDFWGERIIVNFDAREACA
jgi:periplasmic protein TonB